MGRSMGKSSGRRTSTRASARHTLSLQPEQPLHLVPAADHEDRREGEQDGHHDVEAVLREAALLARLHACVPPRPVVAVAELDRGRVYGSLVLTRHWLTGHGRCHPEIVRPRARGRDTSRGDPPGGFAVDGPLDRWAYRPS